MANMPHMRRRESDEWYCPRCNRRWAATEEDTEPCIDTRGDDRHKRQDQRVIATTSTENG